ncbi:MAG TPA: hypothetical protein VLL05_03675 [Terriglobales bacterium]|nr:hypothetical protein [Terriglobales bacterium]
MTTQADQRCHHCGHQRKDHAPRRCTFENCGCSDFSSGPRMDPNSARRNVDELFDKAMLELNDAFSSHDEIKKELQDAIRRAMQRRQ